MRKFLRTMMLMALSAIWATASAQEVTLDFTSNDEWQLPTKATKAAGTYTNKDGYTITLGESSGGHRFVDDYKLFGTYYYAIEIGKKGATLTLPVFDFPVSSIKIYGQDGGSGVVRMNIYSGDNKVSKESASGIIIPETYDIATDYQKGKALTIKIENNYTSRIKKIEIFKKPKADTSLDFDATDIEARLGESFTEPTATLKSGKTTLTGKQLAFTSSNDDVATVDAATGKVDIKNVGTTTITARYAGDEFDYNASEASYTLNVIYANTEKAMFNFKSPSTYGKGITSPIYDKGNIENGGTIVDPTSNVTLTLTTTNSESNCFYSWGSINCDGLRLYNVATITVSKEGYKIKNVETNGDQATEWTYNDDGTATATITCENHVTLTTMNVEFIKELTLADTDNLQDIVAENDGATVTAILKRPLVGGTWNTLCLPFDTDLKYTALEGASIREVSSVDEATATFNFRPADKLQAGYAYLVKPDADINGDIVFQNVKIQNVQPGNHTGSDNYLFIGLLDKKTVGEAEYGKLFGVSSNGRLAMIKAGTTIRSLRAYFLIETGGVGAKLNIDGVTTAIDAIDAGTGNNAGNNAGKKVYDLSGRCLGTDINALPNGVYIVGGKKVLK